MQSPEEIVDHCWQISSRNKATWLLFKLQQDWKPEQIASWRAQSREELSEDVKRHAIKGGKGAKTHPRVI